MESREDSQIRKSRDPSSIGGQKWVQSETRVRCSQEREFSVMERGSMMSSDPSSDLRSLEEVRV